MQLIYMRLPNHIAFVVDGNRRWARKRGLPTIAGHKMGSERAYDIWKKSCELGIKVVTFWIFSTENWNRTEEEKKYLFNLYALYCDKYLKEAVRLGARIVHLGRKDRIPGFLREKIENAEEKTKLNNTFYVCFGLDHGGRDEIIRAVNRWREKQPDEVKIDENIITAHLDGAFLPYPDPDFIIRTSGEQRLSGFLLWRSPYSEYYFPKETFPDFTIDEYMKGLKEFESRQRRFGH